MRLLDPESIKNYHDEAEADMRRLGLDPSSPEAWRLYATLLVRDRRLLFGAPSPDDDDVIEINKASHASLTKVAGRAARLIAKLKEIEDEYLAIERPTQKDVLDHAIADLYLMADLLDGFGISRASGLPTPLLLVLADLCNVRDGRLGRLVSPPDSVIDSSHVVADSRHDRMRLPVQAFAAAAVKRLIDSGKFNNNQAYDAVAQELDAAGFKPPGGRVDKITKAASVRTWYVRASDPDCSFRHEYNCALSASEDEDPEVILNDLGVFVRSLQFNR